MLKALTTEEVESGFIGSLLLRSSEFTDIDLLPSEFNDPFYSEIWKHAQSVPELDLMEVQKLFGANAINELASSVPYSMEFNKFATRIKEDSRRRIIKTCLNTAISMLDKQSSIEDAYHLVAGAFEKADNKKDGRLVSDIMPDVLANIESAIKHGRNFNFESSGYKNLDANCGGLQKKGLIIIAARPGAGKSAFACGLAVKASKRGMVLVASLEMGADQLLTRMLAAESRTPLNSIMEGSVKGEELSRMAGKFSEMTNIVINDAPRPKIKDISSEARRLKRKNGSLSMVVIDYVGLFEGAEGVNRAEAIGVISRESKIMAMELDCPVVLLAQMNRNIEARKDKTPMLSDLRDSGALEQDADQIFFPHRNYIYSQNPAEKNDAWIICAKNRMGSVCKTEMRWIPEYTLFEDLGEQ